jgi:hypothetical protein
MSTLNSLQPGLDNNFSFFVDGLSIEKAKDGLGRDIMKVGGIASTIDVDADEEELDPTGFDVSYFLDNGYLNYNHQAKFNPDAVIGEPTSAKATEKGLYIEGILYPESQLAKSVYDTTRMLEKSSGNRRMGFSIEGQALARDPYNPKKITKAKITGCAITLSPKNPNTLVNIIKGNYKDSLPTYIYNEEQIVNDLSKSDSDYLVHLESGGKIVTIDKAMSIKIVDSKPDIEKTLSTESGAALIEEDVDKDLKVLPSSSETVDKKKKKLTKGEVYEKIFSYIYPSYSFEKADNFYKIIQEMAKKSNIEPNMEHGNSKNVEITNEDIEKSLQFILESKDTSSVIEKGDTKQDKFEYEEGLIDGKHDKDVEEEDIDKAVEKALEADEDYQDLIKKMKHKKELKKSELGYPTTQAAPTKTMSDPDANTVGNPGAVGSAMKLSKGQDDIVDLIKGLEDTLSSNNNKNTDLIKSLGVISKGILDKQESLTDENKELRKSLDSTLRRLRVVEKTPIPSKTVTRNRYNPHPTLEKSFGSDKELHTVRDRNEILNILDARAGLDGSTPDMAFAKGMQSFEVTGRLENNIIQKLSKEGYTIIN